MQVIIAICGCAVKVVSGPELVVIEEFTACSKQLKGHAAAVYDTRTETVLRTLGSQVGVWISMEGVVRCHVFWGGKSSLVAHPWAGGYSWAIGCWYQGQHEQYSWRHNSVGIGQLLVTTFRVFVKMNNLSSMFFLIQYIESWTRCKHSSHLVRQMF